ncbi:hypothetical protein BSZ37_16430 [Rubrivirga marina]|uniref:dTDP-4-dehydrorhamnose reductase n=1 Tax=Rubrivirga marina TaxID=1196024 RepID=A0A271J388_9BACT|nr:hypothetical protein BSZ37_16430 [Rubrivirga marina]
MTGSRTPLSSHEGARDEARYLAGLAEAAGIPLVHLSTDNVFDGTASPHAPVAPPSVYSASKAAGEAAVGAATDRAETLRTARVFEGTANSFATRMLRPANEQPRLAVVAGQCPHPTATADIAHAALVAARHATDGWARITWRHHLGGLPVTMWYEQETPRWRRDRRWERFHSSRSPDLEGGLPDGRAAPVRGRASACSDARRARLRGGDRCVVSPSMSGAR